MRSSVVSERRNSQEQLDEFGRPIRRDTGADSRNVNRIAQEKIERDKRRQEAKERRRREEEKKEAEIKKKAEASKATESVEDPEEAAMRRLMGFSGFSSTSGKEVEGNEQGGKATSSIRKYRQYMNRAGGFNRSLDAT